MEEAAHLRNKIHDHLVKSHGVIPIPENIDGLLKIFKPFIKEKLAEQRQLCADQGKHWKFGTYTYKKDKMINAPEPEL